MPGIGVISNPRSRENLRDPGAMRRLAWLIGSRGAAATTATLDDLYRVAEEWRRERIDLLCINGGDGTIHCTLTAFIRVFAGAPLPPVAILRGGTMNTIAGALGVRGDTARILFELVDRYHHGDELPLVQKELLAVGDAYGFIFGNGVIYNFLDAYYGTGRPSPETAARLLARGALSSLVHGRFSRDLTRRVRVRVTVDGERWPREDFMTVAAACIEDIGLGFRPFPRANERPGAFAVLGIHARHALDLVLDLPRMLRGQPMRPSKAIHALASELRFESDEPVDYVIDGDGYRGGRELRIGVGPRLSFVRLDARAGR